MMNGFIVGMNRLLGEVGGISLFVWEVARTMACSKGNASRIAGQVVSISLRSLPTIAFSGVFVGAIIVLQFNLILARYDAQSFLGGLNTSSVIREVGPLIISFLLAGKIGAFTAAELGTMRVTEQIDAIQCLGTDPIQYLIVPRFVGIVLSSLILMALGLIIGVTGSMWVADVLCGINPLQFANSIPQFTDRWTIFGSLFKTATYGLIVASVACYKGYTASGGARGVGRAVTLAALYTNFYIVIANFLTSNALEAMSTLLDSIFGKIGGAG